MIKSFKTMCKNNDSDMPDTRSKSREARLNAALRDNLKRRKVAKRKKSVADEKDDLKRDISDSDTSSAD